MRALRFALWGALFLAYWGALFVALFKGWI